MTKEPKEAEQGTLAVVETVWEVVVVDRFDDDNGRAGWTRKDAQASSTYGLNALITTIPRYVRTSDTTSHSGRGGPGRSMLARSLASRFWAPLGAAHSHGNH